MSKVVKTPKKDTKSPAKKSVKSPPKEEKKTVKEPVVEIVEISKLVKTEDRVTTPYLTKYERARVIGMRALQISQGAPLLVELEKGQIDPIQIAEMELKAKKLPLVVRRYLPNKSYEDWEVRELTDIKDYYH